MSDVAEIEKRFDSGQTMWSYAEVGILLAEVRRLRKWRDDATAYCPGEFPCEASLHAAEYLEDKERAEAEGATLRGHLDCAIAGKQERSEEITALRAENERLRKIERLVEDLLIDHHNYVHAGCLDSTINSWPSVLKLRTALAEGAERTEEPDDGD
jgi:hypothetical protein